MTDEKLLHTEQVRLRADLVAMLRAIQYAGGGTPMPVLLDPLVRPEVSAQFSRLPAAIRRGAMLNAGLRAEDAPAVEEPLHAV